MNETVDRLTDLPVGTLRIKLWLAESIMSEARANNDPRWTRLQSQVDNLQAAIALKHERARSGIPRVIVRMNPARMQVKRVDF